MPKPQIEEAEKKNRAEKVLKMITSGKFEIWYATTFESYITGDEGCVSKDVIISDLITMMK